jgi:hypothetical protein
VLTHDFFQAGLNAGQGGQNIEGFGFRLVSVGPTSKLIQVIADFGELPDKLRVGRRVIMFRLFWPLTQGPHPAGLEPGAYNVRQRDPLAVGFGFQGADNAPGESNVYSLERIIFLGSCHSPFAFGLGF